MFSSHRKNRHTFRIPSLVSVEELNCLFKNKKSCLLGLVMYVEAAYEFHEMIRTKNKLCEVKKIIMKFCKILRNFISWLKFP